MELKDYLNRFDRFAAATGVELTEVGEGFAKAVMTVEERHLNGANVCQGGAIYTLADLAFAAAVNSHGLMTVGTNNGITYLRYRIHNLSCLVALNVRNHLRNSCHDNR